MKRGKRETRFRLISMPMPRYVGVHREVVRLLWYLDHDWNPSNARMLRRRLEAADLLESPYDANEDIVASLEEFPDLLDRLWGMLRDYERVLEFEARVAELERAAEEERSKERSIEAYNRIMAECEAIRLRVEGRAKLRYPKSKAWQTKYIRESLAGDEDWRRLCEEKESLPSQVASWAYFRRNMKTA